MQTSLSLLINKNNVIDNLAEVQSLIKKNQLIIPILKSNAYGHGIESMIAILHEIGFAELVGVADIGEAERCLSTISAKHIMILFPGATEIVTLLLSGYHVVISSNEQLAILIENIELIKTAPYVNIHFMCSVGFQRDGLDFHSLHRALSLLREASLCNIDTLGIASHIPANLKKTMSISLQQTKRVFDIFVEIEQHVNLPAKRRLYHIANTCATFNFPELHYSAVRIGEAIYGLNGLNEQIKDYPTNCKLILSCVSQVESVRQYCSSKDLEYNQKYRLKYSGRICTSLTGYTEGMFALDGADYKSGDIYVVIRDRVCPIFSPPMMNHVICFMPVADVDIKSGDTIHIFGTLSSKSHTLVSWARVMNRRVGELLLQLSNNINRIIY